MMTTQPFTAPASASEESAEPYVRDTVHWLERAVIGLNLCPFAKAVHVKGQIHYAVTLADDPAQVLDVLRSELTALALAEPERRDTTLLVVPRCLTNFIDFNDFLDTAEVYPVPPSAELVGVTEEIVGRWLQTQKREHFIVATKVIGPGHGWFRPPVRGGFTALDRRQIIRACEDSLRRLQTENPKALCCWLRQANFQNDLANSICRDTQCRLDD